MAEPFSLLPFDQAGMGLFGPGAYSGDLEEQKRRLLATLGAGLPPAAPSGQAGFGDRLTPNGIMPGEPFRRTAPEAAPLPRYPADGPSFMPDAPPPPRIESAMPPRPLTPDPFVGPIGPAGSSGAAKGPGPLSFADLGSRFDTGVDATPKGPQVAAAPQPLGSIDPLSVLTQRGTFDSADRYTPSPFEQRLAQITGVAYGQSPQQFDPRLRMMAAQQMAGEGLANAELGMKGSQFQQHLAAQQQMAQAENQNRLDVARIKESPDAMKDEFLMKMSLLGMQQGIPPERMMDQYRQISGMLGRGQQSAVMQPGMEKGGFGQGMPTGIPPLGMAPDQHAAEGLLSQIRDVLSVPSAAGAQGGSWQLRDSALNPANIARVAQIYSQANLNPAAKAEFLKRLNFGISGGIGDLNQLRQKAASEAARAYLQANDFGRGPAVRNAGPGREYPEQFSIPNPNVPGQALLKLGSAPRTGAARTMSDLKEAVLTNPLSLVDESQPGVLPYDELTAPGSGTIPFDRSSVMPSWGQAAAQESARRNLDSLLRFYADIAPQPQQPR